MKKNLLILIAALVSLPAIAQDRALKPVSSNQLEGTWFGLYMGSQASRAECNSPSRKVNKANRTPNTIACTAYSRTE